MVNPDQRATIESGTARKPHPRNHRPSDTAKPDELNAKIIVEREQIMRLEKVPSCARDPPLHTCIQFAYNLFGSLTRS